jgi:hypothetical protein
MPRSGTKRADRGKMRISLTLGPRAEGRTPRPGAKCAGRGEVALRLGSFGASARRLCDAIGMVQPSRSKPDRIHKTIGRGHAKRHPGLSRATAAPDPSQPPLRFGSFETNAHALETDVTSTLNLSRTLKRLHESDEPQSTRPERKRKSPRERPARQGARI